MRPAALEPATSNLANQILQELAAGEIDLPMLPKVAADVLSSIFDDAADAAQLAGLIQQDQVLASRVLKVVNSPAYRGAAEIIALQQAIARLGLDCMREIALSASMQAALYKHGSYREIADRQWQLALAAGLWAKEVARACRKNVEIAYLCGLLHSVGVPLLLSRVNESDTELPPGQMELLIDLVGTSAGVAIVEKWQLPAVVAHVIAHQADFSGGAEQRDLIAIVHSGVRLAGCHCGEGLQDAGLQALSAFEHLSLYPEDVAELLEKADAVTAAMESLRP